MTDDSPAAPLRPSALGGLALCVLVASLGTSAANVALPTIAHDLDGTFAHTQWVAVAYLLAMTATSLTVGHLGDRIGRRRMLLCGVALFALAAALCAAAPTLELLIAARALQGVGAAVMMTLPLALVRDTAPAQRLGAAMGLLGTTAAVGTASGPALGGVLIGLSGWPMIFAVMAPLGLLAALLVRQGGAVDTHPSPPVRPGFDALGVVLLTAAIGLYTLGATASATNLPATTGALLGGALLLAALFVVRERRAAAPVLPLALLRMRGIGVGAGLNLIVGTVMMSTLVVGPFYLAGALHLPPAATGATMAAGPLASVATGMLAGRAVDRFGARPVTTAGLTAMTLGALALAFLPGWWGLVGYIGGTVLLAPGYQLFLAANNTAVLGATASENRGVTAGLLGLSRNLGLVTGASVIAALFAAASGAPEIGGASPEALTTALRTTFVATAALLAVAVAVAFSVGRATERRSAVPTIRR